MLAAGGEREHVTLQIGQIAPDFEQDTSNGSLRLHEWIQGSWCLLFSCPSDRVAKESPRVLASLADAASRQAQWKRRRVRLIGLAVRSSDGQARWQEDLARNHGVTLNFPVVADADRLVSRLYSIDDANTDQTRAMQEKCHVFVIDPYRMIRLARTYPAKRGCDFADVQAAIDKLQKAEARSQQSTGQSTGTSAGGAPRSTSAAAGSVASYA